MQFCRLINPKRQVIIHTSHYFDVDIPEYQPRGVHENSGALYLPMQRVAVQKLFEKVPSHFVLYVSTRKYVAYI